MPRFAANLSFLYPELDFLERFEAASTDGFRGVEYLFPYAYKPEEIAQRLKNHHLKQVLFNAPAAGKTPQDMVDAWNQQQRGTASLPDREQEFRTGIHCALDYAQALECQQIHVMSGLLRDETHRAAQWRAYLNNLEWACQQALPLGIDILIEPINGRDMPGYFLQHQSVAHDIVQQIDAPNLKVQMDLYHCQIMEGDLSTRLRQYLPTGRVGHLQIAGVPDRHEPHIGELNADYLFKLIDDLRQKHSWTGWIGCEYRPQKGQQPAGTTQGLSWMKPYPQ